MYQRIYNLKSYEGVFTRDLHSDVVSEHPHSIFIVHKVEIANGCPRTVHMHTILKGLWLYTHQLHFTTMKEHFLSKKKAHQK